MPAAMRTPTIWTGCAATRLSSWPAGGCRTAGRPVLAADRLALGECAGAERPHPADRGHGRCLLRQLRHAPEAVTLDIDDTLDVVHGDQQLSLFHAHYDERCFLPIHSTIPPRPPRRGGPSSRQTPSGKEVAAICAGSSRRIRWHWPETRLTIRGDGHYGRPESWTSARKRPGFPFWCDRQDRAGRAVEETADPIRPSRADLNPACAASPRPVMRLSPGTRNVAPSRASKPRPWARYPLCRYLSRRAQPSIYTRRFTAPAARPRT